MSISPDTLAMTRDFERAKGQRLGASHTPASSVDRLIHGNKLCQQTYGDDQLVNG